MIRNHVRVRGASALGATAPGQRGPFGPHGAGEDDGPDVDDGLDDGQHEGPRRHLRLPAATVAGQPTERNST